MQIVNSIKFKFTAGVFFVVAAVTVIMTIISYDYEKRVVENRVQAQLNAIANLKKAQVVSYLNERQNDLKILATGVSVRKQVKVLLGKSHNAQQLTAARQYFHQRLSTVKHIYSGYRALEVIDLKGDILVSSEAGREHGRSRTYQKRLTGLRHSTEALQRGSTIILQDDLGAGRLNFATGIEDDQGRIRSAIASQVNLEDSLFPLFLDYTGLGRTGEVLLMKRTGRFVTYINPTRHQPLMIDGYAAYGDDYLSLSRLATSGSEGVEQGINHRGKAVIGAYRYIQSLGWGLVAQIEADEVLADISDLRRKSFLITLAILALLLITVYFGVRNFLSPITQLIHNTKAITAGSYAGIVKSGRKDEIGELEENFNEMVVALDAARLQAGVKQEDLERKVHERTENLARANEALSKALEGIKHESEEKKSLQAQLLHAQKMEAVGTLAGGIAHDFNNILTAIIGYGNVMRLKLKETDPLREYLDRILAASERAASLTHSLLAFSRKQIINPQPVNLNEIIGRVEKLLARLIGEDIELRIELSEDIPIVLADSGQVEQVLMNLATNARDAMPKGGRFTLKTEVAEIDHQFIASHGYGEMGSYAVISVIDTGTGMSEQTRARIFEPFFTTKETGKGTGLGLAIVYGIVKAQKGYINCYSEPDKGTTFKVYLPLTQGAGRSRDAAEARLPQGGQETILVAEDSADVRNLTTAILTDHGYTVIEAVDGVDAVNKYMENRDAVGLLLFDIIMPRKNGKDAYEEIKKIQPNIKCIFTSGYTDDIIRQRAFLEESLTLLTKPLSPRDLLVKIREVLNGRSPDVANQQNET